MVLQYVVNVGGVENFQGVGEGNVVFMVVFVFKCQYCIWFDCDIVVDYVGKMDVEKWYCWIGDWVD